MAYPALGRCSWGIQHTFIEGEGRYSGISTVEHSSCLSCWKKYMSDIPCHELAFRIFLFLKSYWICISCGSWRSDWAHSQTVLSGVTEIGICGSHPQKLRLGPLTNGLCTRTGLTSSQLKCQSSILTDFQSQVWYFYVLFCFFSDPHQRMWEWMSPSRRECWVPVLQTWDLVREPAAHSLAAPCTLRADAAIQREGGFPCIQLVMSVTKAKGGKCVRGRGQARSWPQDPCHS